MTHFLGKSGSSSGVRLEVEVVGMNILRREGERHFGCSVGYLSIIKPLRCVYATQLLVSPVQHKEIERK